MRTLKELILPDFQIMKQYDELQAIIKEYKIFQGEDEMWKWFAIDKNGLAYYYNQRPMLSSQNWQAPDKYKKVCNVELKDLDFELSLVERK